MNPRVSIVIPTYNERENLKRLIPPIFKQVAGVEVIVVDDSSPDGTADEVRRLSKRYGVRLILRPRKMGLTSAVMEGFGVARARLLGVMDADLKHPPEAIPRLIEAARKADLVIASRFVKGGGVIGESLIRKLISRLATFLARFVLRLRVRDPLSGFFLLKRDLVRGLRPRSVGFKLLLSILVDRRDRRVVEVAYVARGRRWGRSKFGAREVKNYICTILSLMLRAPRSPSS
jgi:dolichol-phosphate mannosyltransferase